jgi:hypothetical protein
MALCMEDYERARQKGIRLYDRIQQNFSVEHFIDRHIQLYQEMMGIYDR